ncbi:MAG: regulatory protein RecX [Erysipelotrichaceae bacterium]
MIVKNIKFQNDAVIIRAVNDDYKVDYKIALEDYDSQIIVLNKQLSSDDIDYLEESHRYYFGLTKCLKKLTYKDLTVKELRQYMNRYEDLSDNLKDRVINSLLAAGYLDQDRVIEAQIYSDQAKLKGQHKSVATLRKRGIEQQAIDEAVKAINQDDEFQRAVTRAGQIVKNQKNLSYKQQLYDLRQKLISDGFGNVDEVIDRLELQYDYQQQLQAGQYQLNKILRQYQKKYKDKKLKDACYKYLYNKGFTNEVILNLVERNLKDDN